MSTRGIKKSFNKSNSVTFNLVYRSQKDPLIVDETASKRVLIPIIKAKEKKTDTKKYQVVFDNEYEYLKHLKDVNILSNESEELNHANKHIKNDLIEDKSNIILPSSVFESNIQEKIGLLSRGALNLELQLNLDPDIVAALDNDFDFNSEDNILEDNFIELANKEDSIDISNQNVYNRNFNCLSYQNDKEKKELYNLSSDYCMLPDEEAKSHFTEYSITSSVINRNEQLNLLDQKFEKIYVDYDENEIGDLNNDEIDGHIEPNSNVILLYAKEYKEQQNDEINNVTNLLQDQLKVTDRKFYSLNENENTINLEKLVIEEKRQQNWDCESILSTYSNIYNIPKVISEQKDNMKIKFSYKINISKNILNTKIYDNSMTNDFVKLKKNIGQNKSVREESTKSAKNLIHFKPKTESLEEKRNRKNAVKNEKKIRRCERKATLNQFKREKMRQEKVLVNEIPNGQVNRIF